MPRNDSKRPEAILYIPEPLLKISKALGQRVDRSRSTISSEERIRNFWREVSGAIGAVVIVADLYVFLTKEVPSLQAMFLSMAFLVAGVVLILMAIAYEQVKAHIGLVSR